MNLTVQTGNVTVTQANIAGQQVNNVYVVNVNESFSVSVMPIDSITQLKLGQIQWANWRWLMNIEMYSLPTFNSPGQLVPNSLLRTTTNLVAGTVTQTNLVINATGMYILKIVMTTTNNQFSFQLTSNGILVKQARANFVTDIDSFSSNMTFDGDFDTLNRTNQLEIKRAMIYNYLLSIGMPLASDIVLIKGATGNIIALFEIEPLATNASNAVSILLANPSSIPGLNVLALNINSRSYSVEQPETSETNQTDNGLKDVGLTVGLVVGLVTTVLLTATGLLGYWLYQGKVQPNTVEPTQQQQQQQPSPTQISVSDFETIEFPPVVTFPSASPTNPIHVTQYFNPTPSKPQTELIPFH